MVEPAGTTAAGHYAPARDHGGVGEGGLREPLLIEAGRFPGAQRDRIGAALALMSRLHERDRRQRVPYSCRPLRVTIRILSRYRVTDVACAALLPDTVEDHAGDIAPGGSRQAALAVRPGSSGSGPPGWQAQSRTRLGRPGATSTSSTREHVAQSLDGSLRARVIKVPDITGNAVGLFRTTGPSLPGRAGKYLPLLPVLREIVLRADIPLADDVKRMIAGKSGKAGDRLDVIGGDPVPGSPASGGGRK